MKFARLDGMVRYRLLQISFQSASYESVKRLKFWNGVAVSELGGAVGLVAQELKKWRRSIRGITGNLGLLGVYPGVNVVLGLISLYSC